MTRQNLFFLRCLLAMPGIALLLTSAILLGSSAFGMSRYTLGLLLHLVGQGFCVATQCLPRWIAAHRQAQLARRVVALSPPLGNGGARPAHFRMSIQGLRLGVGLILVGGLAYGLLSGLVQTRNLLLLRHEGVMTTATVTGTSYREGGQAMTVTYSFPTPHALPVAASFRAPRALIGQYQTGSLIPVTYLPANPYVHLWQRVGAAQVRQRVLSGLLVGVLVAAYAALPALALEWRLRRQLRLARVGAMATGVIEACRPHVWRGNRRGYWLTYAFALPGGARWRGQAYLPHVPGEPTLPGFPISVLYDAALPSVNRPLAAFHAVQLTTLRQSYIVS